MDPRADDRSTRWPAANCVPNRAPKSSSLARQRVGSSFTGTSPPSGNRGPRTGHLRNSEIGLKLEVAQVNGLESLRAAIARRMDRGIVSSTTNNLMRAAAVALLVVISLIVAVPFVYADTVRPTASFTVSPSEADTGQAISFSSTSTDPDGTISSYAWDFDGNGTTDATGANVSHSFADNGTPTVTLTVTDDDGASRSASHQVTVRNRPPTAAFSFSPAAPRTGDEVVLTSSSSDADGTVAQQRWDLDNDGAYDDATGPTARTTFATAGSYTVALEVVDDDGAKSASFTTIDVEPRPASPPASSSPSGSPSAGSGSTAPALIAPRLLAPFPLVRVRGIATAAGVRLDMLSVRTPGGTRILVLCKGGKRKGCPWSRKVQNARFSRSVVHSVRIPGFKRRYLRAGSVLEVYVTRAGAIGKYTRFTFRSLKPPKRVDSCTAPGAARVKRCPS